jgi:prephenate dehydrogenase
VRIAIIGLGLIGGSIGLALKKSNWRHTEVVGYARRNETASFAKKICAVDKIENNIGRAVNNSDIVIIATPILTVKAIFSQIAPYVSEGTIVTDTASTKVDIMRWADELLPSRVSFIGGHPMAGKEISSIKAATADLFHKCTYCLTPSPNASASAIRTVKDMVKSLKATPLIIEAEEHDRLVAGISHLPLLMSVALVLATTRNSSWPKMSRLAASGYRDMTRLASGKPEISAHICLSNGTAIVSWIDMLIEELQNLRKLTADRDQEIERALSIAHDARQKWLEKRK